MIAKCESPLNKPYLWGVRIDRHISCSQLSYLRSIGSMLYKSNLLDKIDELPFETIIDHRPVVNNGFSFDARTEQRCFRHILCNVELSEVMKKFFFLEYYLFFDFSFYLQS